MSPLDFVTVRPCRFDSFEAVPRDRQSLDLGECETKLRASGYDIVSNVGVMLIVRKGIEVTVYPHGRLLMHPVRDKTEAEKVAGALYAALGM